MLLPTLPDEPSAEDLMGPSAGVDAHRAHRGVAQTEDRWFGLCPRKSVASLDEFRRVVASDERLTAYYRGFNWTEARLVTTDAPRLVYVAYQKAGALARTRRPMLLPKGDTLVTDGVIQARTYCCNEVFEPVDALASPRSEPDPAASLPSIPLLWDPQFLSFLAPPAAPAAPAVPASSPPATGEDGAPRALATPPVEGVLPPPPAPGHIAFSGVAPSGTIPPSDPPRRPRTVVSEPSTVALLSLVLAGLVWCRWWARRRAGRGALRSPRAPLP